MAESTSIVGTLTAGGVESRRPPAASAGSATKLLAATAAAAVLSAAVRASATVLCTISSRYGLAAVLLSVLQSIRHAPLRARAAIRGTWGSATI